MFTLDQIKNAHSKVQSGADFPKYIQDLKQLGVKSYTTFVNDGHAEYHAEDGTKVQSEAKYHMLKIAAETNAEQFILYLKMHQQGQTDYMTFCNHAAETGIDCWKVNIDEMTCTYYDDAVVKILTEKIPG